MRDEALAQRMAQGNPYVGKTRPGPGYVPRPDRSQPQWRLASPETLRRHQQWWDDAEAWRAENEQLRRAREAEVDAREAARERARREAAEAALIAELRRRYFAADPAATEDEFQRDLPELRRRHRIAAALREPAEPDVAAPALPRREYAL